VGEYAAQSPVDSKGLLEANAGGLTKAERFVFVEEFKSRIFFSLRTGRKMTPVGLLWEALSSTGNLAHARSKRSQDGFADIDTCAARHSEAADQCLHAFTYFSRSLSPLPAAVHDVDGRVRERGKDWKTTAASRARRRDKLFALYNRCGDDRFGSWAMVTGARRQRLFHNTTIVLLLVAAVGVLLPDVCKASRSAGGLGSPRSRLFCGATSDGSYMYADTCEQCSSQSPSACAGDCTWDAANARCMPAASGLQTTRRQSTSSQSGSGAGSASPGSSPASNITSTCGNARIESPETCDDGDATAGDGCRWL
jgi:cysteine-rich repeat protein